jgi:hypothetical protein
MKTNDAVSGAVYRAVGGSVDRAVNLAVSEAMYTAVRRVSHRNPVLTDFLATTGEEAS